MKVLKRNQLIVLVISLMLITAGYLNFTANQENVVTSTIAGRDDATIGDAQLVSTIPKENEEEIVENLLTGNINNNEGEDLVNEQPTSNSVENENDTNTGEKEDYYFTTSKLERNTMYSENLETYQEMYNNTNATAEAKADALAKINNINNTKNAINIKNVIVTI